MGSTTSCSHRCLFDAAGSKMRRGFSVKCSLCGRASMWQKMLKCERDGCHQGFAHKRCVEGALRTDHRDTHQRFDDVRDRIAADLHRIRLPVDTANADASTQPDCIPATADSCTQTIRVPATADSSTQTDRVPATADLCTQTIRVPVTVDSSTQPDCIPATADSSTQTDRVPATADSSMQTDHVPATADSNTQTDHVPASADSNTQTDGEPFTAHVNGWTQTACVATSDVACGDEITNAEVASQTSVATCHAESEVETVLAGCSYTASETTHPVVSEIDDIFAEGSSPTNEARETDTEPGNTLKYWNLRFTSFSKFDAGIMLDEVSLRSACTEVMSRHLANRCWYETVLNPFCGAGGIAIQLAFTCSHVIAMDADPVKIALAKRNAQVYGVADRIDFRVGDFFAVAGGDVEADAVIASPQWAKLDCARQAEFDAGDLCHRDSGVLATIIRVASAVAPKVVLHLPKHIDRTKCLQMATDVRFSRIQYESVTIDKERKCQNIYFTRNDTNVKGLPLRFSGEVHLRTPSLLEERRLERASADNTIAYASYLKSVDRFLDT